jgi:hydrogenase expression/formation protein HypD
MRQALDDLTRAASDLPPGRRVTVMEVCGTHTMAIARAGLRALLPPSLRLISGPGCPVCVTPVGFVDHALALARLPRVTLATFGDMMRVPGSQPARGPAPSLALARAAGADVRVVYSPLEALALARTRPEREVVFLGVGFETTAPGVAAAVERAADLANFSVLSAHKTVPAALAALASMPDLGLDGFLLPGHVSVILGPEPYGVLAERHGLAAAIAGFEPEEILRGLAAICRQVARGEPEIANCYPGAVRPGGNPRALAAIDRVFAATSSVWRGLGPIPGSGLGLRPALAGVDAGLRFAVELPAPLDPPGCRCGEVLSGRLAPEGCPLFGRVCAPDSPVGACMVSSEGSCAAAWHFANPA